MPTKKPVNFDDYVFPLNMNGLQGRMLKAPAPGKSREILLVYGHHATLERWFGLVHELSRYGGVTMPDLPGFGGMESLRRLGEKPSLDIYADYLAAFIKLRYKQRRLTIVAEGFGFLVATRMLQRYKTIAKKVDLIVGLGGFAHHEDLKLSRGRIVKYRLFSVVFSFWPVAWLFKSLCFNPKALQRAYLKEKTASWRRKLEATAFPSKASEQANLWRSCDLATHLATIGAMLGVDNCASQVDTPVCVVNLRGTLIDKHLAEQHLRVAYSDCQFLETKLGHRKNFGADAKAAADLLPHGLRNRLKRTKAQ